MTGFDTIKLLSTEYEEDELGQKVPHETEREVFARVESVSRAEFFDAGRIGIKPSWKVTLTFAEDYEGEELAEYDGKRYAIYRTYQTTGGGVELYLRPEAGVTDERADG